jgi:hypothetical protein
VIPGKETGLDRGNLPRVILQEDIVGITDILNDVSQFELNDMLSFVVIVFLIVDIVIIINVMATAACSSVRIGYKLF